MSAERMLLIVSVAVVTYLTRVAGFSLGQRTIPPAIDRFLTWVPVASFAALAVPGIADGGGTLPARIVGALLATAIALRFGALWACLLAGMAGFWVVGIFA
jgi:branched-subunit amino acid transport protein